MILGLVISLVVATSPVRGDVGDPSIAEVEKAITSNGTTGAARWSDRIWSTPLGLLVKDYVNTEGPPAEVTRRSHQITTRIFSSDQLKVARMSAIHILITNLFERGLVDSRVHQRIGQLQSEIGLRKQVADEHATDESLNLAPLFIVLGGLSGSPVVRGQVANAFKAAVRKLAPGRGPRTAEGLALFEPGFLNVLRDEFRDEYSFKRAAEFGLAGYASTTALLWYFESGEETGSGLKEHAINLFLQDHVTLEDL